MVQWVKNSIAAIWVTVEVRVRSLAQHRELKNLASPQLPFRSSCQWDSIPGLGTSICHGCSHKNKNKFKSFLKTLFGSSVVQPVVTAAAWVTAVAQVPFLAWKLPNVVGTTKGKEKTHKILFGEGAVSFSRLPKPKAEPMSTESGLLLTSSVSGLCWSRFGVGYKVEFSKLFFPSALCI